MKDQGSSGNCNSATASRTEMVNTKFSWFQSVLYTYYENIQIHTGAKYLGKSKKNTRLDLQYRTIEKKASAS